MYIFHTQSIVIVVLYSIFCLLNVQLSSFESEIKHLKGKLNKNIFNACNPDVTFVFTELERKQCLKSTYLSKEYSLRSCR